MARWHAFGAHLGERASLVLSLGFTPEKIGSADLLVPLGVIVRLSFSSASLWRNFCRSALDLRHICPGGYLRGLRNGHAEMGSAFSGQ